jgi:hypothetical protein
MTGLSKKHINVHKTASFVIFALYLVVTTSIDLFHSDDCEFNTRHTSDTDCIFSNAPCPACTFLAGHNSMGVSHGPALLNAENIFISQFAPSLEVVRCCEWACSIASRAPPMTVIS